MDKTSCMRSAAGEGMRKNRTPRRTNPHLYNVPKERTRALIALSSLVLALGGCHWPKVNFLGDDYVLSPFPREVNQPPGSGSGTAEADASASVPRSSTANGR